MSFELKFHNLQVNFTRKSQQKLTMVIITKQIKLIP